MWTTAVKVGLADVQGTLRGWERNPPQGQPPGGGLQGATAVRTHLHGQGLSGAGVVSLL